MTAPAKFKAGDIVIWVEGGTWSKYDVWGKVLRVTPKGTVFARQGGKTAAEQLFPEREFRNGRGLRIPSAYELQHRLWYRDRPRGALASLSFGLGRSEVPQHVHVDDRAVNSPMKARALAEELLEIAEWWEREPQPERDGGAFDWSRDDVSE